MARLRVCPVPGCPTLTHGGRCPPHLAQLDATRGRRQARGYDVEHDRLRRRWERIIATRSIPCARCHQPIPKGGAFDLGHNDRRNAWTGPEHPACNRAAGGRASHPRGVTPS